jgi:hypothetical protein
MRARAVPQASLLVRLWLPPANGRRPGARGDGRRDRGSSCSGKNVLADARQNSSLDLASNSMSHDCDPSMKPVEQIGRPVGTRSVTDAFLDDVFFSSGLRCISSQPGFPSHAPQIAACIDSRHFPGSCAMKQIVHTGSWRKHAMSQPLEPGRLSKSCYRNPINVRPSRRLKDRLHVSDHSCRAQP